MERDHSRLLNRLQEEYTRYAPGSKAIHERAFHCEIDGGSHAIRLMQPFPPRISSAFGAVVRDEDGHEILDFWQGHLANLLGHNPRIVTAVLARMFEEGSGLQTGFTDRLQAEVAEKVCRMTGSERVRFTTSGSLATMYAIMLARSFTGRTCVMKVGGGWHGAQPWGLKAVNFADGGFTRVDSEGIPAALTDDVLVTAFNDAESLEEQFRRAGDSVACLIVEPFIGAGGLMPARPDYMQAARRLTERHGALLVLDEVVSGFRFRAGDLGSLFGIRPDLSIFGKVMGGGMPVAAVAGRADVLALAGRESGSRVKFSGGTFSAHPASMLAARTILDYLEKNAEEVYPHLTDLGRRMRRILEDAFTEEGIYARCTGYGNEAVPEGSLAMIHFPYREDTVLDKPEQLFDPAVCDVAMSSRVLQLALLLEDVHMIHGHGGISTAHTEEHLAFLDQACRRAARRML